MTSLDASLKHRDDNLAKSKPEDDPAKTKVDKAQVASSTSHNHDPARSGAEGGVSLEKQSGSNVKFSVQSTAVENASDTLRSMSTLDSLSFTNTDEVGTVLSSLDEKPSSIGGKSTASIATFAMDEKESLRPDDSASIAAAAEDEDLQGRVAGAVDSNSGSNEEVRAFREQLNEISAINPIRHTTVANITQESAMAQSLYVPDASQIAMLQSQPGDGYEVLPDVKLLEALENPRDRIWVLKLEQDVIDFVKDAKESSLVLPQCNSFYRMLAHKIADYYMLGHAVDDSSSAVRLFKSPTCRIPRPLTGEVTPSTAASTPPPSLQMKILRRGIDNSGPAIANGSNMPSKSGSENGDDDEKKPVTREEREARYEAARLRIMGAAKPDEAIELKEDESRSSSVSGRKGRKTRREDSDDDFEARSAYNSFYAPAQGGFQTHQYAQPLSPTQFQGHAYAQYAQGYYAPQDNEWTQPPPTFDLAREFERSLSFQRAPTYSAPQSPYEQTNFQQPFPAAYGWQGVPTNRQSYQPAYDRPSSSASQPTYAYGQLPSQALGRPPNALEHPLPGSYKSRHFNPQSQAFIPGTTNLFPPLMPPRTISGPIAASPAITGLEREMSSQSQGSQYNSPIHGAISSRMPPQSLTHPLPQPVFHSHVAPAVSLPPKPSSQRVSLDGTRTAPPQQSESTIAKWGTPASLPPKPPPAIEQHIPGKRSTQTYAMPSFGSMPAAGT